MKRVLLRTLGGIVILVCLAIIGLYVQSSRIINKRHEFRAYPVAVPTDSASIAYGERLARMRCHGCHADSLYGQVLFSEPMVGRLTAANVPAKLATVSDAEFAGFLRTGVRKDGTSPFVMPPPGFYHISDSDLGALIAYLRTIPQGGETLPPNSYGPMGRLGIVLGEFNTAVAEMDTTMGRIGQDPAWATTRHGEYLARMICTECHGLRLVGDPAGPTPSLSGALGYSLDEFTTLIRTGTPREAGKTLSLMREVATNSLKYLTDAEIAEIYQYIKALPPSGVAGSR